MTKKKARSKSMPKWAKDIFNRFLSDSDQLLQTLRICTMGMSMVQNTPQALEALMDFEDDMSETSKDKLAKATKDAALSEAERKHGFPLLNSWGLVAIWALLEAMVKHFVAEYIGRRKSAWNLPELGRIRIRLGEYESIPLRERYFYVADLLEKEVAAGVRNGVNRFESLLTPFGLNGQVPPNISKQIFELGQIRNAIVHRAGKVDAQLIAACPWLKLKKSRRVRVTSPMMRCYVNAVHMYVTILICRIQEQYGVDMTKTLKKLADDDLVIFS